MLIELLAYVLLGLVLTLPAWRLLRYVGRRMGWCSARLQYMQPYVNEKQRPAPPTPATKELA